MDFLRSGIQKTYLKNKNYQAIVCAHILVEKFKSKKLWNDFKLKESVVLQIEIASEIW